MQARVHLARLFRNWARAAAPDAASRRLRWARLAARVEPSFSSAYQELVRLLFEHEQYWDAVDLSRHAIHRFDSTPDAWVLLGDAFRRVYRYDHALHAYEQALWLEDRVDAAMASGHLLRRLGRHRDAAARFALAHAAGGGSAALRENAQSLHDAGDFDAAAAALSLSEEIDAESPRAVSPVPGDAS